MKKTSSGFTIVELLIVIVVIAILAAIIIVAFNGIQDRARASQASSALSQSKKKLELYKVDNTIYPTTNNLATAGISNAGSLYYQYTSDGSSYCLTASTGGKSYSATNTSAPASGACSGHVSGGTIANLSLNPSVETNLSTWQEHNNRPFSRVSTWSQNGTYSMLAENTTTGTVPIYIHQSTGNFLPVSVGTTYTASAYVYPYGGTSTAYIRIEWKDSANLNVNWTGYTTVNISGAQRLSITGTAPANTTYACIWIVFPTAPASGGGYVDAFMFTEGSSTFTYADGNSSNWSWSGTANNSTSTGPPL